MEQWIPVIGEVGFPIVITMYLLIRIEGKLEVLSNSISELTNSISTMKRS
ncbi:YvrJ family protein [Tepidibacillus fermentans]|uniref:YvrJ-like protein n=1 Tax=Tepidibacillus fermentans TaxID=1281767 RepID=A0A4R3KE60_9BACI|nr:YvrJ family protein [Tepidibacillus fermentans]TCS81249.1 YvrJ-like protein [Tepidibacillus fermentans]